MSTEGSSQDEGQRKPTPSPTSASTTPTSAASATATSPSEGGGSSLRRPSLLGSKLSAAAPTFVPKTTPNAQHLRANAPEFKPPTPNKPMTPLSPAGTAPPSLDSSAGAPVVPKLQPPPKPKAREPEPAPAPVPSPAPPASETPPPPPPPPTQPKSPKSEKERAAELRPPTPSSPKAAKVPSPRPQSPARGLPSPVKAQANGEVEVRVSPRGEPPSRVPEPEMVQPRPERLARKIPEVGDEEQERPSAPGRPQQRSTRPNGERLPTDAEIGSDGIIRYSVDVLRRINLQSFKISKPDDLVVPVEISSDANINGASPAPGALGFGGSRIEPPDRRSTATPRTEFSRSGSNTPFGGGRDSPFSSSASFSTGGTPRGSTPRLPFGERSFPGPERSFPGDRDFGGGGGGLERTSSAGQWERNVERPGFGRSNSRGDFGRDREDRGGRRRKGRDRSHQDLSMVDQEEELKRLEAEKRFVPTVKRKILGDPAREEETEAKIKAARSLLNKLSLEKFDKLSDDFVHVGFTSQELLQRAIEIIVEKAQDEVHFSKMYADLCRKLSLDVPAVPKEDNPEETIPFRTFLLERCQHDFYEDLATRLAKFDDLPPEVKTEKQFVAKHRYLGHMRFIGELFLQGMLRTQIVHECLIQLLDLNDPDEEKLECAIKLLTTTGKNLELHEAERKRTPPRTMNSYFEDVAKLSKNKKLSSRIRFMLDDLVELRKNDYKPRRETEQARTLSDFKEAIAKEQAVKAESKGGGGAQKGGRRLERMSSRSGESQDVRSSGRSSGGELTRSTSTISVGGSGATDDGWETVSTKKPAGKPKDDGWSTAVGKGGKVGMSRSTSSSGALVSQSSFAALMDDGKKKKKKDKEKDRDERKDRKEKDRSEKKKDKKKKDNEEEEEEPEPEEGQASPASRAGRALTREEAERKGRSILEEYFHLNDVSEAIACVRELNVSEGMEMLVNRWITKVQDHKEPHFIMLADLVLAVHQEQLVSTGDVVEGLRETMESMADVAIDVPHLAKNMATFLGRLIVGGALSPEYLQSMPQTMVEGAMAANFVVDIILQIKSTVSAEKAKEVKEQSQVDFKALLSPDVPEEEVEQELTDLMSRLVL